MKSLLQSQFTFISPWKSIASPFSLFVDSPVASPPSPSPPSLLSLPAAVAPFASPALRPEKERGERERGFFAGKRRWVYSNSSALRNIIQICVFLGGGSNVLKVFFEKAACKLRNWWTLLMKYTILFLSPFLVSKSNGELKKSIWFRNQGMGQWLGDYSWKTNPGCFCCGDIMDFREANQCVLCWNSHKEKTILFKPLSKMYTVIPFKQDVCTFYTRCTETLQFLHAQTHCLPDTKDRGVQKIRKNRGAKGARGFARTQPVVVVVVVLATFN